MDTIYRKTERGLAEMATRALGLAPRLRAALIVVDGKKTLPELQVLLGTQCRATLHELHEQGLLEAIRPIRISHPELPPAGARQLSDRELESLRRRVLRWLGERLSSEAESVKARIERSRTSQELLPVLFLAQTVVDRYLGAESSQAFHAEFIQGMLPS